MTDSCKCSHFIVHIVDLLDYVLRNVGFLMWIKKQNESWFVMLLFTFLLLAKGACIKFKGSGEMVYEQ